jgi:hypothetical protein
VLRKTEWVVVSGDLLIRVLGCGAETYADVDQSDDDEDRQRKHDRVERDGGAEVCDLSCVSRLRIVPAVDD